MRRNTSSGDSTGLPTRFSVAGALLVSLAASLAVVGVALAMLYPVLAAGFVAGGATASLAPVVVRHIGGRAPPDRRADRRFLGYRWRKQYP